ncbi:Lysophospholipid acyltransferase 5 [Cryptotermes secundus]|uniref:Lysophospholipid acyltransferase 5 n=1 Tax=Cryptotermes secundus TaxID=105785 RepID=A0A2J7RDZ6_9NEOP|nr:lysophospholipid acyltransferase 5 [Cryptotermes secundus]XP_033606322.1 lysophospholipid acyltransferase 5 [Cryptotermes secundus]PNF39053.1 Lysophospholipid acyltransferase 5 [Cryptotermes secundus]
MAGAGRSGGSVLSQLAYSLGAPEPALRLLVSILLGYPLALIHRYTLFGQLQYQHLFFVVSGLSIGYFNYGWEILHSVTSVLVVYGILRIIGGTLISVICVFIFTMAYLLAGYYMTGTETYDIKWSMPQCVLTLRLIGLAFDLFDGKKLDEELSQEQKKTALSKIPSLLEVAGYTYFPASFLVGPQFPMKRYQDFVAGIYRHGTETLQTKELPDCLVPGLKRGGLGFVYLGLYQIGTSFFPDCYLLGNEFQELPFWKQCLTLGIWGKITLYKYISCWLISEGVCIIAGLTYNGKDSSGKHQWDGCANVKLRVFEGASKFGHYIASFNINTNHWVAQYIYKRLKFLGNRYISQAAALIFLAVWHGLHSGYYMCFLLEFVIMKLEKDFEKMLEQSEVKEFLNHVALRPVTWLLLKLYTFVFMGYCLVPFVLLSYSRWNHVYASVYYFGHFVFFPWPVYSPFVRKLLKLWNPRRAHQE